MKYNFDEIIDRKGTNSIKYDFAEEEKGRDDLLPLWVADMDFKLPKEVEERLEERVKHGIFGYTKAKDDYYKAVAKWFYDVHDWRIDPGWIVITPGVVYAIAAAIRAFTKKGDGVIIQQPVYYPFYNSIIKNERKAVNNELLFKDGRYSIDFDDFEKKIRENDVKMFILCSPHNPVGRVWTKEELTKLGEICLKYDVLIFADEIHGDITYPGIKHVPFVSLSENFANITIVGTAPSKTFNLAGLQLSDIIIPNEKLREKFKSELNSAGYALPNTMGLAASQAVYELGYEWYREMLDYIYENYKFLEKFIKDELPKIKIVKPEGTYLVWLDFSRLGLTDKELEDFIVDKAKLWLDGGSMFGKKSGQFQRINIACPKETLKEALERLKKAADNLS